MIPLSGFLSRALSTRYLFAMSAAGFTLASILCAFATSINQMIAFRAFQGFIGGGMIPTAFAASYLIFPKRAQAPVMAVVGLTVTLAPTIGPTVGGYLTELFSWRWLFLINVVPGIAATVICWLLVDFDKPDLPLLKRFDFVGLATMAVFLGSLQYVLEEGQTDDWFADETIVLMSVLAAAGAIAFFVRVTRSATPIVDLGAYRDRNFAVGSTLTFVLGIGLYGLTYLYPLYLARIRGFTSLQIGETVFVTGVFMFLTAPVVGILARKIDPRRIIFVGLVGFAVSCVMLTPITQDWAFEELFLPQAVRGVSLMLCMVPINVLALGTLPPDRIKNASGLFNLMRNLGGAVGLAIINTLLQSRTDLHYARLSELVRWGSVVAEERIANIAAGFASTVGDDAQAVAIRQIGNIVSQQANLLAFSDIFLMLAVVFGSMVFLLPLLQRPRMAGDMGGGH